MSKATPKLDTTVFAEAKRAEEIAWPRREPCRVELLTFPKRHRIKSADEFKQGWRCANLPEWFAEGQDAYLTYADDAASQLMMKIQKIGVPLRELADVQRGATPFTLSRRPTHKSTLPCSPRIVGSHRRR